MQGGGIYGAPLPYGLNSMTSLIFIGFIHRAGGTIFAPDLSVAIDSHADRARRSNSTSRCARSARPAPPTTAGARASPPSCRGATATGIYAGRVLQNVNDAEPGHRRLRHLPHLSDDLEGRGVLDLQRLPERLHSEGHGATWTQAKAFAAFLFQPPGYIQQLHAAPGHVLPVLKTIAEDPAYQADPIIQKYPEEVGLMAAAAAGGYNLGYETAAHKPNVKANDIIATNVLAEMVQRVVLNGEDAKAVRRRHRRRSSKR